MSVAFSRWRPAVVISCALTLVVVGLIGLLVAITRTAPDELDLPQPANIPAEVRHASQRMVARYRRTLPAIPINSIRLLHGLRNLPDGPTVGLDDRPDGITYVSIICNNDHYRKVVGGRGLVDVVDGLPVLRGKRFRNDDGEVHFGQMLMFLGEMNVGVSTEVVSDSGIWTLRDIVSYYKKNAHSSRDLSWLLPALVRYVPWNERWTNKFGERVSLQGLLKSHIRADTKGLPCGATHHFYAVAAVTRRLSSDRRAIPREAIDYLAERVRLAELSQLPDGSWDEDWLLGHRSLVLHDSTRQSSADERMRYTGHLIECLALCRDLMPIEPDVVSRAIGWVCDQCEPLIERANYFENTVLSHAIHGLILWLEPPLRRREWS